VIPSASLLSRRRARLLTRAATWSFAPIVSLGLMTCAGHDLTAPSPSASVPENPVPVASLVLTGVPTDSVVLVGQTLQFSATPMASTGAVLTGRTITWTSSNTAIASVSSTGLVSAVASGILTIAATSEGQTVTAVISVRVALNGPQAGSTQATTATAFGGAVSLMIPPGTLPASATLNVIAAAAPAPSDLLVVGTAFTFGPSGTQFAQPLTLQLRFDPSVVPASERNGLAVFLEKNGAWEKVAGSAVSATDNAVTAPITHFSTYALLRRPPPATLSVTAGNNQSAMVGAVLPLAPAVTVLDAHGNPVEGTTVSFVVASGGGTVAGSSPVTDAQGVAILGGWTLGPAVGTQDRKSVV
jgi:hypothetical protein